MRRIALCGVLSEMCVSATARSALQQAVQDLTARRHGIPLHQLLSGAMSAAPQSVPLYATLDRIDGRLLDASRDLGVGGVRTFLHVTLPLSRPGLLTACVVTALPMFGDYYTNTLVSVSPRTTMVGNQIELYLLGGSRQDMGASLVLIMSAMLMVLMAYYLISSQRADRRVS